MNLGSVSVAPRFAICPSSVPVQCAVRAEGVKCQWPSATARCVPNFGAWWGCPSLRPPLSPYMFSLISSRLALVSLGLGSRRRVCTVCSVKSCGCPAAGAPVRALFSRGSLTSHISLSRSLVMSRARVSRVYYSTRVVSAATALSWRRWRRRLRRWSGLGDQVQRRRSALLAALVAAA
jgi:hypothetical protein